MSLSVVTDSIIDIQALLGNVSLINEIYFVINPIWVKCGVILVGAISSNLYLGAKVQSGERSHKIKSKRNFLWQVGSFAVGDRRNSKARYIAFFRHSRAKKVFWEWKRSLGVEEEGKENKRGKNMSGNVM